MTTDINEKNKSIWNTNAAIWDKAMGDEGNRWHNELIAPKTLEYLNLSTDDIVLDIGCGNGIFARRLRTLDVAVTAFDFSEENIRSAHKYESEGIAYRVLDATQYDELLKLGEGCFDSAVSNMVLMDIPTIEPLFEALPKLLKNNGTFVFSIQHPCFNSNATSVVEEEVEGEHRQVVKIHNYIEKSTGMGDAIEGQPQKQYYFHRPISAYLDCAFKNGFVVEGFHEPAFNDDTLFSKIPPVLIVKLRKKSSVFL